ncbi:MAG: alpha/beta fold hydrolase [Candidatus Poribacteria bacterium]|jgi:cephalosporin-C deacetylase-like acetyl esterase|nr:alpha/beta fold hydrolase [Candidatus Poribacteria bacterium]MDP6962384.1 alpha/beta fold hydrolase [Dehalococcoidia bacterium]
MLTLKIDTDQPNGIFENGQHIQPFVLVDNHSDKSLTGQLMWRVTTDTGDFQEETTVAVTLPPGSSCQRTSVLESDQLTAGFYRMESQFQHQQQVISDQMMIGYQPDLIQTPLTRQPNFDDFWSKAETQLRQITPNYRAERQPNMGNERFNVYLVEICSVDNLAVRGWLEIPKSVGKHPALLRVPGYGETMTPLNAPFDWVTFSFNPRGHGNSDDTPDDNLGHWVRGLDQPNSYFYRGAYMDVLRAMDYLLSRPEVDPEKGAVWGASQGGGFSLVVAALRPQTRYCIADVPFLCNWQRYFQLTQWDEIDQWLAEKPETRNWSGLLKTLSYFDTINLTPRIEAEVLMAVGLQDPVCPPATCFASYNQIKGKKACRVYKTAGHNLGQQHRQYALNWLESRFNFPQNPIHIDGKPKKIRIDQCRKNFP